ncbi:MAG: HAD family acid phosphatase [Gammaproteobacteria bacterium]|nr:HAD family acid phosphatase [Gammaproteobacteria bacterium]
MNFKKIVISFFILIIAQSSYALENLDTFKKELIKYHDTGKYERDIEKVIDQATAYLKTRVNQKSTKKLAMVLDIDETSLSNYNDMLILGFGGKIQEINDAEGEGKDAAIKPTLEIYNYAKAHNVAVFFITGRTEKYRTATENNLQEAGYHNWDALTLKSENYSNPSAAPYKIAERKAITKKGYDIIINIGDQESDLKGGYADKTFKLPNPYYFIP